MNATLLRFGYPACVVHEYRHWVVLIRPAQITLGCTIIAAKSDCTSLGALSADAGSELPRVIADFEAAVRRMAPVSKFNYLALMMVDPNPHFHAIPRYAEPTALGELSFVDQTFPQAPDLQRVNDLSREQLERVRLMLVRHWPE